MLLFQSPILIPRYLQVALLLICSQLAYSQSDLTNNGGNIIVGATGTLYVNGSIEIQGSGEILNDGTVEFKGDWFNLSNGGGFSIGSIGEVQLTGATQLLGGATPSLFPSLTLLGSDNKTLGNAITVSGILSLGNRNLSAALYPVEITNADSAAIETNGGFVYTGSTGSLIRHTNSTQSYLFPLGEWASGTYRPAYFTPISSQASVLGAEFKFNIPSNSGYNVNLRDSAICHINPSFFYIATPIAGNTDYLVDMSYDLAVDGVYSKIASWGSQWDTTINNSTYNAGGFSWVKGGAIILNSTQPLALSRNIATPTINVSQTNGYCLGDTLVLSVTPNFLFFDWSNGSASDTAWALQNGQYQVTVNQAFDCWAVSAPANVVFDTITTPTLTVSGNNAICDGDSLMVIAPAGYTSYNWSNGATNDTAYLVSTGNYNLTVSNGTNCTASALNDVVLTVNAPLLPTLIASHYTGICAQDSIELAVLGSFDSYAWSTGAQDSLDLIFNDGTYTVEVTDSNLCQATDSITITRTNLANPIAEFSYAIMGSSIELTDLSANADTYSWTVNGVNAGTMPNLTYPLPQSGSFEICLTVLNACDGQTTCDTIVYTGIETIGQTTIEIYPNPTANYINILAANWKKPAIGRLINMLGQQLLVTELPPATLTQIDIGHLTAGNYQLEILADGITQNFIIQLINP